MIGPDPADRADGAGQQLARVLDLAATTAAGLARRLSLGQWHAVETGLGDLVAAALQLLPAERAAALAGSVTIWIPPMWRAMAAASAGCRSTTKAGGVRRPHVATCPDTATVLAADLLAGKRGPPP